MLGTAITLDIRTKEMDTQNTVSNTALHDNQTQPNMSFPEVWRKNSKFTLMRGSSQLKKSNVICNL